MTVVYKKCLGHGIEYYYPNCPICYSKKRLICDAREDEGYQDIYAKETKRLIERE